MEKQEEKKKSFLKLLQKLQEFDSEVMEIDPKEIKELVGDVIPDKVDNCREFLLELESRAEIYKKKIDELAAAKKTIENQIKSYKRYLAFSLQSTGTTKMPGNLYSISLQTRKNINPVECDLTAQEYIDINLLQPGTVERVFKFNLQNFKKLAKNDATFAQVYASEDETAFVQFRTSKEPKQ